MVTLLDSSPILPSVVRGTTQRDAVDEQTRKQCFDIFVDQLRIQSESRRADDGGHDDMPSGGESDGEDQRRKKDKKGKDKSKKRKHRDDDMQDEAYDEEIDKSKKHKKHKHKYDGA